MLNMTQRLVEVGGLYTEHSSFVRYFPEFFDDEASSVPESIYHVVRGDR